MGTVITIIVIVVVLIAAAAAFYAYQRRRSGQLQERFGPEYERTLEQSGDRRTAERDLHERERRRSKLELTPLSDESAAQYRAEWDNLQGGFVDAPGEAVAQADRLVLRMMRESGYPVDEFDQRADDISVDHPEVAENYRQAHRVAVAQTRGEADTEDLRQAVTAYRRLVVALLDHGHEDHTTRPTHKREQA
ncbi:hypothetical protein F1D05_37685 [Kribbella qitaiheensis]|uniref:Secreted protein n=1 Tax=Kribbella qitaiheensis TaxID=1544730 RepID=A0A7G6X8M3_9ACTN|nr:hypothetical protein [Kribbella qitaiheensis]QNE22588.1 hypothetical protein F1D05_37685 [Kribbella qitaiheensis]